MPDKNLQVKLLSSLEKLFPDEMLAQKTETNRFTMFRNERLAFQLGIQDLGAPRMFPRRTVFFAEGVPAQFISVRQVVCVPSVYTHCAAKYDENYLRLQPGLFPDLLQPLEYDGKVLIPSQTATALWLELELPPEFPSGDYHLTLGLKDEAGVVLNRTEAELHISSGILPPQTLIHTEWFHTDCIAEAYGVNSFSEKHWKLIEEFMKTAVRNGINMILTPVFTPVTDIAVGGERLTTQLVEMEELPDGKTYRFDYQKLERWLKLCKVCGVEYLEIPHLFTQWGAEHTPKIVICRNGQYVKRFGWHTDALSAEYQNFLSQFLPSLTDYLRQAGWGGRCMFHISDEPIEKNLEQYRRCKELVAPYLNGFPIADAISDVHFYDSGAVECPIPYIGEIQNFLGRDIDGLWAYYCGACGTKEITDRLLDMPLARTRILGVQLWLYHIKGFLHWGYNFYHNRWSMNYVDPYLDTTAGQFVPSGDAFVVYPGKDGTAWETMRLAALRGAMEDYRALEYCEALHGRTFTEQLLLEGTDGITFFRYPKSPEFLLNLHRKLVDAIEAALQTAE